MRKKVITDLDCSEAWGPDCILLVSLNFDTYKLIFSNCMRLHESCFTDHWKLSFLVPVLR